MRLLKGDLTGIVRAGRLSQATTVFSLFVGAQAALLNRYRREISPDQRIAMTLCSFVSSVRVGEYANSINCEAHWSKELTAQPFHWNVRG
jgi:hypothetical protein